MPEGIPTQQGTQPFSPGLAHMQISDELDLNKNWSFGAAIKAMKMGIKVRRAGWNGKGMFLYHVPANSYPAATKIAFDHFGQSVPYGEYIAMKTAQENVVPWLASQTDMLSNDWELAD